MSMRTFQFKRGTAAAWAKMNPVLDEAEPGFEEDTGNFKLGDGSRPWNSLPYWEPWKDTNPANEELVRALIEQHVISPTPHPVYDDGVSFLLLYENAKV